MSRRVDSPVTAVDNRRRVEAATRSTASNQDTEPSSMPLPMSARSSLVAAMTETPNVSSVAMRSLRPLETCEINGYRCEVLRQARRTTYLRVLDSRLPGRAVVQLDKKLPDGSVRMVGR